MPLRPLSYACLLVLACFSIFLPLLPAAHLLYLFCEILDSVLQILIRDGVKIRGRLGHACDRLGRRVSLLVVDEELPGHRFELRLVVLIRRAQCIQLVQVLEQRVQQSRVNSCYALKTFE